MLKSLQIDDTMVDQVALSNFSLVYNDEFHLLLN